MADEAENFEARREKLKELEQPCSRVKCPCYAATRPRDSMIFHTLW